MQLQVFNPPDAPVCEKCDLPLGFVRLDSGKWRPCNPDGSDHWDVCRDVRYAKAKSGECIEETRALKNPARVETIVYWNGGKKPFIVMHSVKLKNQPPIAANGGGFIPLEQHQAHAAKHGYTVIESNA